ncbi:efflux transporter outer membrane subunit [Sphingomonas sp. LHG3406-1]|uniref:efflux transporter outer membrane subunit n=1 Tax=Sphingomonas sp. LHG3406-1 TaxID=2804617 RepID=UPI0026308015|nr:efflux transporter outer membrane subunit [Sphingomonas sp. LHG3406-1]
MRALLLGVGALALASCVAGPGKLPTAAEVILPPAFRFAPDAESKGQVAALLPAADPAFSALSAAALADAPTLAAALARIDTARANADRARAERLPEVNGALSVDRARSSEAQVGIPDLPGISIDRTRTTFGADLSARWDPDLFGGLRARQRAALARIDAASADAAAVRLALVAEIAGSVLDWRTLSAREAQTRENLAAAERLAELAGVRERAGIAPGADRVRAETLAAGSRTGLEALGSERARILGRLVTLTARPAAEVERLLATQSQASSLPLPPPALPSTLLSNRPDVLAAGARLRAADAEVAAAAAARFPRLTLSSALGLLSLTVGGLFDGDAIGASVGGDVAGPLLDFGRVQADIRRSEASTFEAFADYRDSVFTALGDAEGGYALVSAADRELRAALDEAAANDRSARLAETRFRAGLTSFLDVIDARRQAIFARERAAAAEGRARRARITLWQALGGS